GSKIRLYTYFESSEWPSGGAILCRGSHHKPLAFAGILSLAAVISALASTLTLAAIAAHALHVSLSPAAGRLLNVHGTGQKHRANCGGQKRTLKYVPIHGCPHSLGIWAIARLCLIYPAVRCRKCPKVS